MNPLANIRCWSARKWLLVVLSVVSWGTTASGMITVANTNNPRTVASLLAIALAIQLSLAWLVQQRFRDYSRPLRYVMIMLLFLLWNVSVGFGVGPHLWRISPNTAGSRQIWNRRRAGRAGTRHVAYMARARNCAMTMPSSSRILQKTSAGRPMK